MYFPRTLIHLGVENVEKSVAFYEALLGTPPLNRVPVIAVFEVSTPPLVLTLEPRPRRAKAGRNRPGVRHFAMVVPQPEEVGSAAVALRRAGARLRLLDQRIEATDPDGNVWRVRFEPTAKERSVVPASADSEGAA